MEQFLVQISNFYHSGTFAVIKFILAVYVIIIAVDIILIIILREPGKDIKAMMKGADYPLMRKSKMKKRWEKVAERLKTGRVSQFKAAILEADSIADKILSDISYKGNNMAERLEKANASQINNLDDLRRAHELRNRIIREKELILSLEEAKEIIGIYRKFLEDFEFI